MDQESYGSFARANIKETSCQYQKEPLKFIVRYCHKFPLLPPRLPAVNVREDYHNNTKDTESHTSNLHRTVFCFQNNKCQHQNARDRPAVQYHHTCYRCVLIRLHHYKKAKHKTSTVFHHNNSSKNVMQVVTFLSSTITHMIRKQNGATDVRR